MFISSQQGRLSLIRHDRHMRQTAELARQWNSEWFHGPEDHAALVTAMELHDAGWTAADDAVMYDAQRRRPLNFMFVGLEDHIAFYREGYERALAQNDESGLLVGMHWIGLYTSRFGLEPDFVYRVPTEEGEALRRATVERTEQEWVAVKQRIWSPREKRAAFEDRLWRQYEVFQFLDRLSITACMNDLSVASDRTAGEVRLGNGTYTQPSIALNGDGSITVDPFPFSDEFTAPIERRWIPDEDYGDHSELVAAVDEAPMEVLDVRVTAR